MVETPSRRRYLQLLGVGETLRFLESGDEMTLGRDGLAKRRESVADQPWSGSITPLAANEEKALVEVTVRRNLVTEQPTTDDPVLRSAGPLKLRLLSENARLSRAFPLPSKREADVALAIDATTIALGVATAAVSGGATVVATAKIAGLLASAYNLMNTLMEQNEIEERHINYLEFREMNGGEDTFLIELERIDEDEPVREWQAGLEYDAWRDYRGNQSDVKLSGLVADRTTMQACRTGEGENRPEGLVVTGRVLKSDGTPATNSTVVVYSDDTDELLTRTHTDSDGAFTYEFRGTVPHRLGYLQVHDSDLDTDVHEVSGTAAPTDGSPDVYAARFVEGSGSRDLGRIRLPEAHKLDVSVVDEDGDPVSDERVGIAHWFSGDWYIAYRTYTNADGEFEVTESDDTGVEVHGDVTVFVGDQRRDLYVDEPKSIEIAL